MGFTNLTGDASPPSPEGVAPVDKKTDFNQRLSSYFEKRYPVAGGLANAVFGGNSAPAVADASLPQLPNQPTPDYSMLAMNAKPESGGGGLSAILKLIGM